jgi:hypothetical protein
LPPSNDQWSYLFVGERNNTASPSSTKLLGSYSPGSFDDQRIAAGPVVSVPSEQSDAVTIAEIDIRPHQRLSQVGLTIRIALRHLAQIPLAAAAARPGLMDYTWGRASQRHCTGKRADRPKADPAAVRAKQATRFSLSCSARATPLAFRCSAEYSPPSLSIPQPVRPMLPSRPRE